MFVCSEIINNLYLSDWNISNNPDVLQKYGIKAVYTIVNTPKPEYIVEYMKKNNIAYLHHYIEDSPFVDISKYFNESYDFIKFHIDKPVLVHCMAGISRSSTIVMNYLIKTFINNQKEQIDINPELLVNNILEFVMNKRSIVNPNQGFLKQLIKATSEYIFLHNKRYLNFSSISTNMDTANSVPNCNVFKDNDGNPGNVIPLTNDDFDDFGNLKNFQGVNAVIYWWQPWCKFCVSSKSEFVKFSRMLDNTNIRAFSIEGDKNLDLVKRINPLTWGFKIAGFPSIIGYNKGRFYSEYGIDPNDRSKFRTATDLFEYAVGLGDAKVVIE